MEGRHQKGSFTWISGILLVITIILNSCFTFTDAIEATISADQVALWGSTITLSCTMRHTSSFAPSQIIWYKDLAEAPLTTSPIQVVGNNTSTLQLSVVTDEDTGTYYCALPSDGDDVTAFQSSRVTVGKLPASATGVECQSRDSLAFWCTWQAGASDPYLETQYTFQYLGAYENRLLWRQCPDYVSKGEMSCYIPALSNTGREQRINITATNALGSTWSVHTYNPNRSTIPHPPTNVRAEVINSREVRAKWDIPADWKNYMSNMLSYRLRIWEDNEHIEESNCREIPSQRLIQRGRFIQASFHTIHNLQPGAVYSLQAACKYRFSQPRGGRWSNWSEPVDVKLPALAPSGTVDDLEVTEYPQLEDPRSPKRDASLRWEAVPTVLQNGPIVNYTIYIAAAATAALGGAERYDPVETLTLPADVTSYEVQGLNLHQKYDISISACNSAGCGPNATTQLKNHKNLVPLRPMHLRVLDLANQSLEFSWTVPNYGGEIDHYLLQWTSNPHEGSWDEVEIPGDQSEHIVNGPSNPATYSFRVQAFNSLNEPGPWSRTLSVRLDGIELTFVSRQ